MIQQLGEQDASYLYLETPECPQHVGSLSLVTLPPGHDGDFYETYKRHIASRLHLVPLMHTKLLQLPFDLDHPFWIQDDAVDIDYHVRHQTLPRPGRMRQLEELVGRLHSNFLDRSRPLFELYLIDGLESGQVAIYSKIHHAAMDGASSQQLIATLYDPTPEPRVTPPPPPAQGPGPQVQVEELLRGVARHVMQQEVRALHYLPDALKAWAQVALPNAQTLQWDKAVLPPLRPPHTPLNVGITSQRSFAARTLALPRVKRVAKLAQAKVNDVVLALCAAALRRYLLDKDALPEEALSAMVPVASATAADAVSSNQNTAVLCTLATDLADPVARLLAIRDAMNDQKRLLGNLKSVLFPDLAVVGSGLLMRGLVDVYRRARLADRLPPVANLVISNVPGPPVPLYVAGARVQSFHPCSIPFHGQALNITVESYVDALDVGLVACRRTLPDVADLADHLVNALDELEAALASHAASSTRPAAVLPPSPAGPEAAPFQAPVHAARARRTRTAAPRPSGKTESTS